MSVNVSIKEGGEGKVGTVDQLETPKQGGGTEIWYPKSAMQLGTKSVTQNGTYTAASDGKYGFSQFSVNVAGGNGSADSHGKPTGDIDPGGIGSAIEGIDEDGNEQIIGVDEGGNLVKTPLPSSIVLVVEPTKMDYNDGESIDLSGAVVTAKMADGTTWTDVDHPNGHVSCTPDPATATGGSSYPTYDGFPLYEAGYSGSIEDAYVQTGTNPVTIHGIRFEFPASGSGNVSATNLETGFSKSNYSAHYFNAETKIYIFVKKYDNRYSLEGSAQNPRNGSALGFSSDPRIYGTVEDGQEITLKWARPGDGKVLTTTMEINVGAHTTQSSSGTGGSGGGGTF